MPTALPRANAPDLPPSTAETTTAATAEKNKTSSSQDEKIVSQFEGWWNTKATTMFDGSFRFWLKSLN